jgi:hypothetical protein
MLLIVSSHVLLSGSTTAANECAKELESWTMIQSKSCPPTIPTVACGRPLTLSLSGIVISFHHAGSLFEEGKRKRMPLIVSSHFLLSGSTIVINIWGTVLIYDRSVPCEDDISWEPAKVFRVLVWMTWVILICFSVMAILPMQLMPSERTHHGMWRWRWTVIAWCCCCRRYDQYSLSPCPPCARISVECVVSFRPHSSMLLLLLSQYD